MRGIVRDRNEDSKVFRAGRANSRRTAVELLEHRLSPNIAAWVRRFFEPSKVEVGGNDSADFEGGVIAKKLSHLNDLDAPLSLRQLSFKTALIRSTVAQQINFGQLSSTKLEHDFIAWIVRQVEARVDLSMDNRPFPNEVDWRYWLRNLARLAVHSGIHVEVASVILHHLQVTTTGRSGEAKGLVGANEGGSRGEDETDVGSDDESDVGSTAGGELEALEPDSVLDSTHVCFSVGCRRPARLRLRSADARGAVHTDVCCEPCLAGDGHSPECDAAATAAAAASRRLRRERRHEWRSRQRSDTTRTQEPADSGDASSFLFPPARPVCFGPGVGYDETVTDGALSSDDDENGSSSASTPPTKGSKVDGDREHEWRDCNDGWFDDDWYDDARDGTPWFSGMTDPSLDVARGGKSRERRLAELMTGPVVIPEPIESNDAARHRPFTFDDIMALKVTAEESSCAERSAKQHC